MVNVSGGFAYIDMSVYGTFENGTAKTVSATEYDLLRKVSQWDKPVIVSGISVDLGGGSGVFKCRPSITVFEDVNENGYDATLVLSSSSVTISIVDNGDGTVSITAEYN